MSVAKSIGTSFAGEGVRNTSRMATSHSSLFTPHFFRHPLTAKAVPSPYKQGESASGVSPRKDYNLLLTTYLNGYFLSFFSPFAEKTLTNFNIQVACF